MTIHNRIYMALSLLVLALLNLTNARQSVHPASPYCKLDNTNLYCDYEGIKEPISLDRQESHKVEKVYITNGKEVAISGTPCVNLQLNSIPQATFIMAHLCHEMENLTLTVIDTKINIVPKYFSILEMENSSADWLVSDKEFQAISVVNSRIGTLNLSQPPKEKAVIRFENSKILELQLINMENNAQLTITNTTIKALKNDCLRLDNSKSKLWNNTIQTTTANAIHLGPTGSLNLKNNVGEIMLMGPYQKKEPKEAFAPGVPPSKHARRPSRNNVAHWTWIIPTVIATLEAMIIMVNCTNWFPGLKSTRSRPHRPDEEDMKSNQSEPYYSQSAVYFSSEGDVNKRNVRKSS